MTSCRSIRDLLRRSVEGETAPKESLRIAGHLSRCTGCRIVLARERRLARLLDGIEDPLQVDDGFVRGVMSALPAAPPRADRRRGLKLASIAGLLGLGMSALSHVAGAGSSSGSVPGVLRFSYEGMESLREMVGAFAHAILLGLARLGTGLEPRIVAGPGGPELPSAVLLPAVAALVMLFMALSVRSRSTLPGQLSPRVLTRFLSVGTVRPRRLAAEARSLRSSLSTRRT